MHFIIGTYNISTGFRPSGGAFYSSIGRIGMISTNGKTFIPLVKCISFHSGTYASHYREYFRWLQAAWGCILLFHWHDWYQYNNIYSIGIALVKCISLWGLIIRPSGGAFYLSIGKISTIGTNQITFILLGFHW